MNEDQAKKDLAEAYGIMLAMSAWKHFKEEILDRIERQATNDEDAFPIDQLNLAQIGECRGRRNAVQQIRKSVEYIVLGLK